MHKEKNMNRGYGFIHRCVALMLSVLMLSSSLLFGQSSKRPVEPGELVPQEDAIMEAQATGTSTVQAAAQTVQPEGQAVVEANVQEEGAADELEHVAASLDAVDIPNEPQGGGEVPAPVPDRELRDRAAVRGVENGVWLKFALNKSFLPDGANVLINNMLPLKANEVFVIVTYSDADLSATESKKIAQERAEAIKKLLEAQKVSTERIVMLKPVVNADDVNPFAYSADLIELRLEKGNSYTAGDLF